MRESYSALAFYGSNKDLATTQDPFTVGTLPVRHALVPASARLSCAPLHQSMCQKQIQGSVLLNGWRLTGKTPPMPVTSLRTASPTTRLRLAISFAGSDAIKKYDDGIYPQYNAYTGFSSSLRSTSRLSSYSRLHSRLNHRSGLTR